MRSGSATAVCLTVVAVLLTIGAVDGHAAAAEDPVELRLKPLPDGVKKVEIERAEDGSHEVVITSTDGTVERLRPDEFIARIDRETRGRRFLYRLLNITSPVGIAWIFLGLVGQVVFAGRMILQWLVSEKHKKSVVPVAFWWMSLGGASMLLTYFLWRKDVVGVLGQATGWFIYVRNLWLIYRPRRTGRVAADPAPEPGVAPSHRQAAADGHGSHAD